MINFVIFSQLTYLLVKTLEATIGVILKKVYLPGLLRFCRRVQQDVRLWRIKFFLIFFQPIFIDELVAADNSIFLISSFFQIFLKCLLNLRIVMKNAKLSLPPMCDFASSHCYLCIFQNFFIYRQIDMRGYARLRRFLY